MSFQGAEPALRQPLAELANSQINQKAPGEQLVKKPDTAKTKNVSLVPRQQSVEGFEHAPKSRHLAHVMTQEDLDKLASENKRLSQMSASSGRSLPAARLKKYIGPWELGTDLGKGMSGRVRKARHRENGLLVAVKIINIHKASKLQTSSVIAIDKQLRSSVSTAAPLEKVPVALQREIVILKAIEHPNIIKLYDIWENRGDLYLFTEFVEKGELFDYILKNGCLDEQESVRIFRQIVSGLQHCHRFRLCHRDLKPENILMDHEFNVKLADFGMAAMYNDKYLRTACGSPHYAAPEIVRGEPYMGNLSDTWSCGIILYVMMCGRLPFGSDYDLDRVAKICHAILHDELKFSGSLRPISPTARDFISKILIRSPQKRMLLADMWHHPLISSYNGIAESPIYKRFWPGGPSKKLTAEDCGEQLYEKRDIDRVVLKGLCVLWQSSDEDRLISALLSPAASYEKVLYHRLIRYRTEQEENFRSDMFELSASDVHHIAPPHIRKSRTKASLLGPGSSAQRSEYSLVQPGSRHTSVQSRQTGKSMNGSGVGSKHTVSFADTETTYDPYRSSKPQLIYNGDPYMKVDVHRDSSTISRADYYYRSATSRHPPVSSVWESTAGSSLASMPSSPPELLPDSCVRLRNKKCTVLKRCYSKSSMTSSLGSQVSNQTIQFLKAGSYKRNVSFNRTLSQPPRPSAPTPASVQQRYLRDRLQEDAPELVSSPCHRRAFAGKSMPHLSSSTENTVFDGAKPSRHVRSIVGVRNGCLPHEAAVRAGSELSNFCDLAFSSSPAPASIKAAAGEEISPASVDLNAALAARLSSSGASPNQRCTIDDLRNRPLPDPPIREPHALQVQRELACVLRNLKKSKEELGTGVLENLMTEIERVMKVNAPGIATGNLQQRIASSQSHRTPSEELKELLSNREASIRPSAPNSEASKTPKNDRRYFSDPLPHRAVAAQEYQINLSARPTIRIVPRSPATGNGQAAIHESIVEPGVTLREAEHTAQPRIIPNRRGSRDFPDTYYDTCYHEPIDVSLHQTGLHTIEEDKCNETEDGRSKRGSGGNKFKSWFRRSDDSAKSIEKASKRQMSETLQDESISAKGEPVRQSTNSIEEWHENCQDNADGMEKYYNSSETEFPLRYEYQKAAKGFWGLFRRERRPQMELVEMNDSQSFEGTSSLGSRRHSALESSAFTSPYRSDHPEPCPSLLDSRTEAEPTNWLARLLQVRPATRALAFDMPPSKVLREVRGIFREWRKYGVRDIVMERSSGRIRARVTNENKISVKPVEIMVEVYGIVYSSRLRQRCQYPSFPRHYARGGGGGIMSVARMRQVRGAKSSFDQCATQLEKVCREHGFLTVDKKRAKDMKRCLTDWRR